MMCAHAQVTGGTARFAQNPYNEPVEGFGARRWRNGAPFGAGT
jgi:hypothetical protein